MELLREFGESRGEGRRSFGARLVGRWRQVRGTSAEAPPFLARSWLWAEWRGSSPPHTHTHAHATPVRLWVPDPPSGQAAAGCPKVLARQVRVGVGSSGTPSSGILFTVGVALAHPRSVYLQSGSLGALP